MRSGRPRELPVEGYGAIGNLRTIALVGRDGAVAWCCLPELDAPSTFAALVDPHAGGRFRVAPAGRPSPGVQRYIGATNVLETRFARRRGALVLTDLMPVAVRGATLRPGAAELHRIVAAERADVDVDVEWSPRFDYARGSTRIGRAAHGWIAANGSVVAALAGLPADARVDVAASARGDTLRARFRLAAGTRVALVMRYGVDAIRAGVGTSMRRLDATLAAWRRWTAAGAPSRWAGRHAALLERSALALGLLCHGDTGAIAAAATTSLPEVVGGRRNWDYRYAWLRDAGMTVEALLATGHVSEARAFLRFAARAGARPNRRGPWLQLVFGLRRETELPLVELGHFAGYRGSRPVRVGNSIYKERGHDVYEQILGAVLEFAALGGRLDRGLREFVRRAADTAALEWRRPDRGIWEIPGTPRHYVHSKWTACMALDHAIRLADEHGVKGDRAGWAHERDAARADVLERGWDAGRRRFRIAYGVDALDAANVLMPVLGFLPADDPRVVATLRATLSELAHGELCYRYRMDDGLPGDEGCFVACSFWLVEALALAGRVRTARRLLDRMAARASPLGLWAEQIDRRSGAHLGNVPQALSHVGFVDALARLAAAEGTRVPVHPDPAAIALPARHVACLSPDGGPHGGDMKKTGKGILSDGAKRNAARSEREAMGSTGSVKPQKKAGGAIPKQSGRKQETTGRH